MTLKIIRDEDRFRVLKPNSQRYGGRVYDERQIENYLVNAGHFQFDISELSQEDRNFVNPFIRKGIFLASGGRGAVN